VSHAPRTLVDVFIFFLQNVIYICLCFVYIMLKRIGNKATGIASSDVYDSHDNIITTSIIIGITHLHLYIYYYMSVSYCPHFKWYRYLLKYNIIYCHLLQYR